MPAIIYKISTRSLWGEAERTGAFIGAPVDRADGFIHFSTREQVKETASRHFAGQGDLVLVAVDAGRLGEALKWEYSPSRAEDFPHLYAPLPRSAVLWSKPLNRKADGEFLLPETPA